MLIRSLTKMKIFSYSITVVMLLGLFLVPGNFATAATTKLELTQRISQQLSTPQSASVSGAVLGQNVSVPFFPRGFVYPIPQLGNCSDKKSCYEFCEDSQNLDICSLVSFRNGSMTSEQLKKTLAFSSYLQAGYFASCDDLGSCAELCDTESAQADCAILAESLEQGSRVLGAQDTSNEQSYNYSVGSMTGYGDSMLSSLTSYINSGQAPYQCNNAQQCVEYCSVQQSNSECDSLFLKVAQDTGVWNGETRPGRVLNVSSEEGSLIMPTDYNPTPVQPYEPQSYLGCITNKQSTTSTPAVTATEPTSPQEGDVFADTVSQCDSEHSATESQSQNYTNIGKEKANEAISNISDCILGLESSLGIQACLAQ